MAAKKFIDEKSGILAEYLDFFLMKKLSYSQLNHFLWDTLREWDNLNIYDESTDSCKEQVFWFLLFELKIGQANRFLPTVYCASNYIPVLYFYKVKALNHTTVLVFDLSRNTWTDFTIINS